jgi:hypothetical protein
MNPGVLNARAIFPAKFQALSLPEIATLQAGKLLLRFKEGRIEISISSHLEDLHWGKGNPKSSKS